MAAFPSSIACVITEGYKEKSPFRKKYLGSNSFGTASDALIGVTVTTETNSEAKAFERWYLDNGHNNFTINLPIFGVLRNWNVRIAEPIEGAFIGKEGRSIPMKIIVVDNIGDYV